MRDHFVGLAAAVSEDTGIPAEEILLLRHAPKAVRALLERGGTVEEYTALQPIRSRYDFIHPDKLPSRLVVVIVDGRVYEVYEIAGVAAEGTTYTLASPAHLATDEADLKPERPARLFRLSPVPSRVVGQMIRGWDRRERTTVQRADGRFFHEIEVEISVGLQLRDAFRDQLQIELNTKVPETTRRALIEARVGQGRFRQDLMVLWSDKCAVTGCDVAEVLRASHCKPWRSCTDAERLDPANGLLLVATLDALFDAGLIAFLDTGQMLVDASLSPARQRALGLDPAPLREHPSPRQSEFLREHREHVFRGTVH
jgi:hypothetical protein